MQRALVIRAIDGDREAFTQLVDASIDRLYAAASLILRDGDRAQDAVQEALVSAWRDVRSLRDPDAWEAWIHRLMVWSCYRVARKERRRNVVELQLLPVGRSDQTRDHASSVVDRDLLARGLASLPIDQRAVIVLHFYLDRPASEVAEILGIPVGTAKSRLQRGLVALRSSLEREQDADVPRDREGVA